VPILPPTYASNVMLQEVQKSRVLIVYSLQLLNSLRIPFFWHVMLRRLLNASPTFRRNMSPAFLRNVGDHLPSDTLSHVTRPQPSITLMSNLTEAGSARVNAIPRRVRLTAVAVEKQQVSSIVCVCILASFLHRIILSSVACLLTAFFHITS
jgi:hypothetical protein